MIAGELYYPPNGGGLTRSPGSSKIIFAVREATGPRFPPSRRLAKRCNFIYNKVVT